MIVAGFGFRSGATLAALQDALARAGGPGGVTHLATVAAKAGGLDQLAEVLGLPVVAVLPEALQAQPVLTHSERVDALFGTGSVAEAAALAASRVEWQLPATKWSLSIASPHHSAGCG